MKKLFFVLFILTLCILATACVPDNSLNEKIIHLENSVEKLEEERNTAYEQILELQSKISDLECLLLNIDDPDVIRMIAEDLLGLTSPDELIITAGD